MTVGWYNDFGNCPTGRNVVAARFRRNKSKRAGPPQCENDEPDESDRDTRRGEIQEPERLPDRCVKRFADDQIGRRTNDGAEAAKKGRKRQRHDDRSWIDVGAAGYRK